MDILVSTDKNFLEQAYVMLVSLLENNREDRKHIYYLHPDVDAESTDRFEEFFGSRYLVDTTFITVDVTQFEGLHLNRDRRMTYSAYMKIVCADVLPKGVARVLYLDPDIVVRQSVRDLYTVDLGDYSLAAVTNYYNGDRRCIHLNIPPGYGYFNSGVMVIDVEKFRQGKVAERALAFSREMRASFEYHDQDALNGILYDKWLRLHPRWNVHNEIVQMYRGNSDIDTREIREAVNDPAIIHYTGTPKPWEYLCVSPFRNEYRRYLRRTPFRGTKPVGFSIGNMARKYTILTQRVINTVVMQYLPKGVTGLIPRKIRNILVRIIFGVRREDETRK